MPGHKRKLFSYPEVPADLRTAAYEIVSGYLKNMPRSSHPTIVHYLGIPGTGKTTQAKQLQRQARGRGFRFAYLDHDDVMESLPGYKNEKMTDPVAAFKAWQIPAPILGHHILQALIDRKISVIIDHGGTSENRIKLLTELKRRGYRIEIHHTHCPPALAMERARLREELTRRHTPHRLFQERSKNLARWLPQYKRIADRYVVTNTASHAQPR